jgi:radical SAM/Cys-rich protein
MTEQQTQANSNVSLAEFPAFTERLTEDVRFTHDSLKTMQVNVGFKCNLACKHCHVQAGPNRTEEMSRTTMEQILEVATTRGFKTLDITGGAPEMNPNFEWFIETATEAGLNVIVRSNLVILHEDDYQHLPQKYAELGLTLFASLPHYIAKQTDRQRGDGSFDKIISMMQKLNELGYGRDARLQLNLVFNPSGAVLPPDQSALEAEYKQKLAADFGIVFNNLFAITNNPCGRYGKRLKETGNLEGYMNRLIGAFNPAATENMMCRDQMSIGFDGRIYDCDFNQATDMPVLDGTTIADFAADPTLSLKREIRFGNHCYACTAGAGSSCGGETA